MPPDRSMSWLTNAALIRVSTAATASGPASGSRLVCSRYVGSAWTAEEVKLLGTAPDREVAKRIGRTLTAVRLKRMSLRIPCVPEPQVKAIDMPRPAAKKGRG